MDIAINKKTPKTQRQAYGKFQGMPQLTKLNVNLNIQETYLQDM